MRVISQNRKIKIEFSGRRRGGCQIAIEFRDPDSQFLEIDCLLDQVSPYKKAGTLEKSALYHHKGCT